MWYVNVMEISHEINVTSLDDAHRRALEEVIGIQLSRNQRLMIRVADIDVTPTASRPGQTIKSWTNVFEGLTDDEVEAIDRAATTRADLTRHFP